MGTGGGQFVLSDSVTSKKSPNVYKSCPKIILQKTPLPTKMPKNVGKIIVATGFEKLPKV